MVTGDLDRGAQALTIVAVIRAMLPECHMAEQADQKLDRRTLIRRTLRRAG